MLLHPVVNTFGADLNRRFGKKIYRLILDSSFICLNRNGVTGHGVDTFDKLSLIIYKNFQNAIEKTCRVDLKLCALLLISLAAKSHCHNISGSNTCLSNG